MISHYFGLPRCGKSTFAAKMVYDWLEMLKSGKPTYKYVFSNFYIEGAYKIDFNKLGTLDIRDSLIIIDESSLFCDNRGWKNIPKHCLDYIFEHGHFNVDIVFFSQDPKGIDRKIEACCEKKFMIKKFGQFSWAIELPFSLVIDDSTGDPRYGYRKPGFYDIFLKSKKIFRPKYYHLFDSFETPKLPKMKLEKWK